jgi:glyoxylase-like metal-dependent hydrolase (beta-lactamase superfamily II)
MIIVTHGHPDHIGSTGRLQAHGVPVLAHRRDAEMLARRRADPAAYQAELQAWLAVCGVPAEEAADWSDLLASRLPRLTFAPDRFVEDGEQVTLGSLSLEVRWTPGHTPGHIVLWEPARRLLFTGDHVLPDLAPNVGIEPGWLDDPLRAYTESLEALAQTKEVTGLPGHGEPFDPAPRAAALLEHQRARSAAILEAVGAGAPDAYAIARRLWAADTWAGFSPYIRTNAIRTVSAHLARLFADGKVETGPVTWQFRLAARPVHLP